MGSPPEIVHRIREHTGSSPKAGLKPYTIYAKCGATIDTGKPGGELMSAWESEVTCKKCLL